MKSFRDERWSVRYNSNSSKACRLANRHSICICTDRDAFPQMLTGLIKSLFKDRASRESDGFWRHPLKSMVSLSPGSLPYLEVRVQPAQCAAIRSSLAEKWSREGNDKINIERTV